MMPDNVECRRREPMDFNVIWSRTQRAVKLEDGVYEEVGNDDSATVQAMVVVGLAALISGLGTLIGPGRFGVGGWIINAILSATLGLAIGTGILFLVSRLFKAQGGYIQLFRGLGYAYAPTALGIIPVIGGLVGGVWSIICAIRAVKETQSVSQGAAAAIVLIPVAILFVIGLLLAVLVGVALLGVAANS